MRDRLHLRPGVRVSVLFYDVELMFHHDRCAGVYSAGDDWVVLLGVGAALLSFSAWRVQIS